MTIDSLFQCWKELLVEHVKHLEHARVQDGESRQCSDTVPPHCVHTTQDFVENRQNPKAAWAQRHWVGGELCTGCPVQFSA